MAFRWLLATLWVLNFIDGLSTDIALRIHIAYEANPAMAFLYDLSPWVFWGFKIVIFTAATVFFDKAYKKHLHLRKLTWCMTVGLSVLYFGLFLWHIFMWYTYFTRGVTFYF